MMTIWTDEMTAIAAGMKRAGFSAKKIAERLGVKPRSVSDRTLRVGAKSKLDGKSGHRKAATTRGELSFKDVVTPREIDAALTD